MGELAKEVSTVKSKRGNAFVSAGSNDAIAPRGGGGHRMTSAEQNENTLVDSALGASSSHHKYFTRSAYLGNRCQGCVGCAPKVRLNDRTVNTSELTADAGLDQTVFTAYSTDED